MKTVYSASVFVRLTQYVLWNKVSKVRMGIQQSLCVPLSKHGAQHVTQGHFSSSRDYSNRKEKQRDTHVSCSFASPLPAYPGGASIEWL